MIPGLRVSATFFLIFMTALLSVQSPLAKAAAQKPTVMVNWSDPAQFSEMQNRSKFNQVNPEVMLGDFASTIRRHAPRVLKTGQSLAVTITDVTLAGTIVSGARTSGVRVVGPNSPPDIKLRFTLTGQNGEIIDSGDRDLGGPGFMSPKIPDNGESYRYERRLLRNWMDKEFGRQDK